MYLTEFIHMFINFLFVYLMFSTLELHTWPDSFFGSVENVSLMVALNW